MNPHSKAIVLDENIVRVSRQFGEAMVAYYASEKGRAATVLSGEWGAESDPVRQGQSKAGEYAVAQHYCLDLKAAVDRRIGVPDTGTDVVIAEGVTVDVKTTPKGKRWVLWSRAVGEKFWKRTFTHIVGVSIDDSDWSRCWIDGFMTKQEFFDRKLVADGVNDDGKLSVGTWFVEKRDLNPIEMLLAGYVGYNPNGLLLHFCQCGKSAARGVGVSLRNNKLGTWYCDEHLPAEERVHV